MPTHDRSQATATPPLAGYTGYLLRRAFARARDCAQQVLPPGTHPGEGAILTRLAEGGPASQQELSGRLHVNRTIMVKLVDRLEAAGLVRRERNTADRRCYALVVTPRGFEAIDAWGQAADKGELAAPLGEAGDRELRTLLGKLLTARPVPAARPRAGRDGAPAG